MKNDTKNITTAETAFLCLSGERDFPQDGLMRVLRGVESPHSHGHPVGEYEESQAWEHAYEINAAVGRQVAGVLHWD